LAIAAAATCGELDSLLRNESSDDCHCPDGRERSFPADRVGVPSCAALLLEVFSATSVSSRSKAASTFAPPAPFLAHSRRLTSRSSESIDITCRPSCTRLVVATLWLSSGFGQCSSSLLRAAEPFPDDPRAPVPVAPEVTESPDETLDPVAEVRIRLSRPTLEVKHSSHSRGRILVLIPFSDAASSKSPIAFRENGG